MDDNSGREMDGGVFIWKVENFYWNAFTGDNPPLESSPFTVNINGVCTEWKLMIYPSRLLDLIEIHVKRNDEQKSSIPEPLSLGLEMSCITTNRNIKTARCFDSLNIGHYRFGFFCWEWKELLENKFVYFNDGCFTFRCEMWTPFQRQKPSVEYIAVSRIKATKLSYRKSILVSNVLSLKNKIKCLPSPSNELEILLYRKNCSEYTSVDIHCKNSKIGHNIRLNCILTVMDSAGKLMYQMEDCYLFLNNETWNFSDSIRLEELAKKMTSPADVLYLEFELVLGTALVESNAVNKIFGQHDIFQKTQGSNTAINSFVSDFKNLQSIKKFADVQLKSGEEMFPAHKAVLCTRSPVFSKMFNNDSVEIENDIVEIEDLDASALEKLLHFIYTGQLNELEEDMAIKLMSAADTYQIPSLKEQCSIFLRNCIFLENASRILQLADKHCEESLKKAAQEFICCNHRSIFVSDEWAQFICLHGKLASEIFQKLSVKYLNF